MKLCRWIVAGACALACVVSPVHASQTAVPLIADTILKKLPADVQNSVARATDELNKTKAALDKKQQVISTVKADLQKAKQSHNEMKKIESAAIVKAQQQVNAAKKTFEQKVAESHAKLNQKKETALRHISDVRNLSKQASFAVQQVKDATTALRGSTTPLSIDERGEVEKFLKALDTQAFTTQKTTLDLDQINQDIEFESKIKE